MGKLILLYFGTIILMYLSQVYYPVKVDWLDNERHFLRQKSDVFMVIIITWMTCFAFLRTNYNDTSTYIHSFINAETVEEGIVNGTFTDWTGNPWSMFYRSLMRDLTDNYHIYFLIPAVLSNFAMVKLCKRYSVNPAFSLMFFFSIGTYIMYIAALKQCFAIYFLMMALPYAIEKKYVRFYLLLFVAILFHTHAFMFAIVPFLVHKPWGKVTWILCGITLFAMLTYDVTFGAFMRYAQSIGAFVAEDEVFDNHQINVVRVLVYWVPVLFAFFFRERLFRDSTQAENLFTNMSIVSAFILMIGLVEGANLYARMAGYFEFATAITMPWLINKLFEPKSKRFVYICAGVLYFGYFLYEFIVSKNFDATYRAIGLLDFIKTLF